ncbi:hypothetical protein AAF712_001594 [Marasmius tenuissimus]|uniref:Amino acid transporter n=1 Tax=Marasmius tenuissimus TaxID=585030 RepID=A0ABR3AAU7_9AGAR
MEPRFRNSPPHAGRAANADEDLLAALGYKQGKRNFSLFQTLGLAFSIVGLVASFSSVLIFSIPYGGPVAMIWGWTAAAGFLATVALALAELASAAPTSGGLYYWTFTFSPDKYRCFLAWIVGYANTISNIASVASIEWGCAVQIMAAVSIGTGFEANNAHIFGVYVGLIVVHGLMNTGSPRFIARLQPLFTTLNIILCFVVIVLLPALTPRSLRNDASFAFGHFENFSGWQNRFAFILSFLTPAWVTGSFDAPIHMSEEVESAALAIPYAIIVANVSTLVLGWGKSTFKWNKTKINLI